MEPLIPKKNAQPAEGSSQQGFSPLLAASFSAAQVDEPSQTPTDQQSNAQVKAIKVDGVVQSIQVTCSCGEVIVIDCQYME